MKEISAGGVVIYGNSALLLKKFNGDYVLPKGKIEKGETMEEAALREVYEEAGVRGAVIEYLGEINYSYRNIRKGRLIRKTVHWFLMSAEVINPKPQRSEGFIDAQLIPLEKAVEILKFDDERMMLEDAVSLLEGE